MVQRCLSKWSCSWASLRTPAGSCSFRLAAPTISHILELLQTHKPQVTSEEEDTVLDSGHKPKRHRMLLSPEPQIMHTAGITPGCQLEWEMEQTLMWRQGHKEPTTLPGALCQKTSSELAPCCRWPEIALWFSPEKWVRHFWLTLVSSRHWNLTFFVSRSIKH